MRLALYSKLPVSMQRMLVVASGVVLVKILAFTLSALIARVSGAETFGEYTLFITLFILFSEIPVAIDTTYIRAVARRELLVGASAEVALSAALLIKFAYVLAVTVVAIVFGNLIAAGIFGKPDSYDVVVFSMISGSVYSLFNTLIAFYQQRERFFLVSMYRPVLYVVLLIVLSLLVGYFGVLDIRHIMQSYLLVVLLMAFLVVVWFVVNREVVFVHAVYNEVKSFVAVSSVLIFSSTIALLSGRLDVMFLTAQIDFEQLGLYGVALRMSVLAGFVTVVISTILMPRASKVRGDTARLVSYIKLATLYLGLQALVVTFVVVFAEAFVTILFGDSYIDAVPVVILLVLQVFLSSCGIPFQALIQTGDKPYLMLLISVVRMVLSIVLLVFLVPEFGLVGAGMSVLITSGVMSGVLFIISMRLAGFDWRAGVMRRLTARN